MRSCVFLICPPPHHIKTETSGKGSMNSTKYRGETTWNSEGLVLKTKEVFHGEKWLICNQWVYEMLYSWKGINFIYDLITAFQNEDEQLCHGRGGGGGGGWVLGQMNVPCCHQFAYQSISYFCNFYFILVLSYFISTDLTLCYFKSCIRKCNRHRLRLHKRVRLNEMKE